MLEVFINASWAGKAAAFAFFLAKIFFISTAASVVVSQSLEIALVLMTLYIFSVTASISLAVYDIYILKTWDDGYDTPALPTHTQ
tara:strand:+ start:35 stop:289 length:255 start_codon:yes stop_codon:yes gene_type:complete